MSTKAERRLIFAVACITLPAAVFGAPPPKAAPNFCADLIVQYDDAERAITLLSSDSAGDDSAFRATNYLLKVMVQQQIQAMDLTLLQQHKCPTFPVDLPSPNNSGKYFTSSLVCYAAQTQKGPAAPECLTRNWVPYAPVPAALPASAPGG